MDKKYLILINHVSVYYDDFCALHDVTFDIQRGRFHCTHGIEWGRKEYILEYIDGLFVS